MPCLNELYRIGEKNFLVSLLTVFSRKLIIKYLRIKGFAVAQE